MDINFLPEKIKQSLKKFAQDKSPISIVRSSGNLEGKPGEGYIVAFDDKIIMFSRSIGEQNFMDISAAYDGELQDLNLKNEKFNSLLEIKLPDHSYSIKLSNFEAKDLDPLMEKWQFTTGNRQPAEQVTESLSASTPTSSSPPPIPSPSTATASVDGDREISSFTGMAAALMFLASVDNDIAQAEDDYIRKVCVNNKPVLKAGLAYYQNHTFDQLINTLKNIDHTQKLCILANMIELAMGDGVLHTCEQTMIRQFVENMHIDEEEHQAIKDVLLVKNQISVLS